MKVIFEMDTQNHQDALFMGQLSQAIALSNQMNQIAIQEHEKKKYPKPDVTQGLKSNPAEGIAVPAGVPVSTTAVPDATGSTDNTNVSVESTDPRLAPLPPTPYSDIDIKRTTTAYAAKFGMAELVKEVTALGFKQVRTMTSEAKQRLVYKLDGILKNG